MNPTDWRPIANAPLSGIPIEAKWADGQTGIVRYSFDFQGWCMEISGRWVPCVPPEFWRPTEPERTSDEVCATTNQDCAPVAPSGPQIQTAQCTDNQVACNATLGTSDPSEPVAPVGGTPLWGLEDTCRSLWVGPMRPDGKKVSEIVCHFDLTDLTPAAESRRRTLANIVVQCVNQAGPQSNTIRELKSKLSAARAEVERLTKERDGATKLLSDLHYAAGDGQHIHSGLKAEFDCTKSEILAQRSERDSLRQQLALSESTKAHLVAQRDACCDESVRRDDKWVDGIEEACGQKLNFHPGLKNNAREHLPTLDQFIADLRAQLSAATAKDRALRVKLINLLHKHGTGETEEHDGEKIDEMVERIVAERDAATARAEEWEKDRERMRILEHQVFNEDSQQIRIAWLHPSNPTEYASMTIEHHIPLDEFHAHETLSHGIDALTQSKQQA